MQINICKDKFIRAKILEFFAMLLLLFFIDSAEILLSSNAPKMPLNGACRNLKLVKAPERDQLNECSRNFQSTGSH